MTHALTSPSQLRRLAAYSILRSPVSGACIRDGFEQFVDDVLEEPGLSETLAPGDLTSDDMRRRGCAGRVYADLGLGATKRCRDRDSGAVLCTRMATVDQRPCPGGWPVWVDARALLPVSL